MAPVETWKDWALYALVDIFWRAEQDTYVSHPEIEQRGSEDIRFLLVCLHEYG